MTFEILKHTLPEASMALEKNWEEKTVIYTQI